MTYGCYWTASPAPTCCRSTSRAAAPRTTTQPAVGVAEARSPATSRRSSTASPPPAEQAAASQRELGDRFTAAEAPSPWRRCTAGAGRLDAALELATAALALADEGGNGRLTAFALIEQARIHDARGDHRQATAAYQRALAIARRTQQPVRRG